MVSSSLKVPKPPLESPEEAAFGREPWWAGWERLRDLLSGGRGAEARVLARELASCWPDVPAIQHYARALQPPTARRVPGAPPFRSLDSDYAWLRVHAHEYPGQWLAVYEGRLLAAGTDLQRVTEAARQELGQGDAVLFYQPAPAG